jgi:hypothetical protein
MFVDFQELVEQVWNRMELLQKLKLKNAKLEKQVDLL